MFGAWLCEKRQGTAIIGMLVNIKHHSTMQRLAVSTQGAARAQTQRNAAASASTTKPYDRLFFFADLHSAHGQLFAFVMRNYTDSHNLMRITLRTDQKGWVVCFFLRNRKKQVHA